MFYILKNKKPVKVPTVLEWGRYFETANRHVDLTTMGNIRISTVFLGIDHSFCGGDPILFETMIFGGKYDQYQERYTTWEKAERGHKKSIKFVKKEKIEYRSKLIEVSIISSLFMIWFLAGITAENGALFCYYMAVLLLWYMVDMFRELNKNWWRIKIPSYKKLFKGE